MDDLLRIHRIERWRASAVPGQVCVALVFKDWNTVLSRQCKQLLAALARQNRAGRVLDRRDRVDVFRNDALSLEVIEDPGDRVDLQPLIVQRRANDVDTEALQLSQRAAISEFFEDDRVTSLKQKMVDEVDSLP